jgi:hypothetical protein
MRSPAQGPLLSREEIRKLTNAGHDIHDLKGGKRTTQYDLYKDASGNIYVQPKSGTGPGEPTGINVNHLRGIFLSFPFRDFN